MEVCQTSKSSRQSTERVHLFRNTLTLDKLAATCGFGQPHCTSGLTLWKCWQG